MGEVMDRTAEEIYYEMLDGGAPPTVTEAMALCEAAIEGDRAAMKYEALGRALNRAGWSIIDETTDDDDGTMLRLVPPEAIG
jgi:hypothetical protein